MRAHELIEEIRPQRSKDFYDAVVHAADMALNMGDVVEKDDVRYWLRHYKKMFRKGTAPVWRVMRVPEGWVAELKPGTGVGEHWAFQLHPQNVVQFELEARGHKGPLVVLEAIVDDRDVDFPMTVARNCIWPNEDEVYMAGHARPRLKSIAVLDGNKVGENLRPDLIGAELTIHDDY